MYCKNCGKEIPDDSAFCTACGAAQNPQQNAQAGLNGPAQAPYQGQYQYNPYQPPAPPVYYYPYPPAPPAAQNRYNGYGIAGFVLSLCGLLGGLLYAILGLIFSCIGMKKRPMYNTGNSLAKAGKIIGIIAVVIWAVVFIMEIILYVTGTLDSITYTVLI